MTPEQEQAKGIISKPGVSGVGRLREEDIISMAEQERAEARFAEIKLSELRQTVESYYAGRYMPVTPASWYFEMFQLCLDREEQLIRNLEDMTESRDYYQREMNSQSEHFRKAVGENTVLQVKVEQLIAENVRLDRKNDEYIEKLDKQRNEIEEQKYLIQRQKNDIDRLLKMVDGLDFDDENNRLRSVVAEQDKEIQRLQEAFKEILGSGKACTSFEQFHFIATKIAKKALNQS